MPAELKTILTCWSPVRLVTRLDEMATERGVTRSALILSVLSEFAGVEPVAGGRRGNWDGKEDAALGIIQSNPTDTIAEIIERFKDAGIVRGRNWISQKRQFLSGKRGE